MWQFLLRPRERLQSIVMSTTVCVCLSISGATLAISTKFFVHVAYGRGSVLFHRRCDELHTSGFTHVVMFFFSIVGRIVSSMNFATKDRFRLNLLIYRKFGQNSISYY